jgi:hypothetical protein
MDTDLVWLLGIYKVLSSVSPTSNFRGFGSLLSSFSNWAQFKARENNIFRL